MNVHHTRRIFPRGSLMHCHVRK